MKIYFNRPVKREAWGGGSHFITYFHDYLIEIGHDVVFDLCPKIDTIFMFDPRPARGGDSANDIYDYKLENPRTKVIQRINDTDIARPLDKPWRVEMLLQANKIADYTIFISEWVKNHYIEKGYNSQNPNSVILNGCNSEWYYPLADKNINIDNIKLITHHWSDNFMKGFDVYNFLDKFVDVNKQFSFTYMGRYNKQYIPKNTKIIPPVYGLEIGNTLRAHDVYITAARYEACGMHHIEAARCGLPIVYHRDGGGVHELCRNHGIGFHDIETFGSALKEVLARYSEIRDNIDYDFLKMHRCCSEYENVLNLI